MPARPKLSIQVVLGITTAEILAIDKGLAVFHHRQVDVGVADHLGDDAAVGIGGLDVEDYLPADG